MPHELVAVYVLVKVCKQPVVAVQAPSLEVIVTGDPLVTAPPKATNAASVVAAAGTDALHPGNVDAAGQVITGNGFTTKVTTAVA